MDILILTETCVSYTARAAVAAAAGRHGLMCRQSTPPKGKPAAGSGVMIVWRPGLCITPRLTARTTALS